MRVIAGRARGHRLRGPKSAATRPTSDLVRGAVFSALASLGASYTRVLDLYAGTGAMGIEALSRGAGWCDFVERSPASCTIIKENLRITGFVAQAKVHCISAERAMASLTGPYTLILADPPYQDTAVIPLLERLPTAGLLTEDAILVLEQSTRTPPIEALGGLALVRTHRYGDSQVSIYR